MSELLSFLNHLAPELIYEILNILNCKDVLSLLISIMDQPIDLRQMVLGYVSRQYLRRNITYKHIIATKSKELVKLMFAWRKPSLNKCLYQAGRVNSMPLVELFLIQLGARDKSQATRGAARSASREFTDRLKGAGYAYYGNGKHNILIAAARSGSLEFFKYYSSNRGRNTEINDPKVLCAAVRGACKAEGTAMEANYLEIIEYLTKKIKNEKRHNCAMFTAVLLGSVKYRDFFIEKGADDWLQGLIVSIESKSMEMINFFFSRGIADIEESEYREIMHTAARAGMVEALEMFISHVTTVIPGIDINYNRYMYDAIDIGHMEMIEFLISKGAKKWKDYIHTAIGKSNHALVHFFIAKEKEEWRKKKLECKESKLISLKLKRVKLLWNKGLCIAVEQENRYLIDFLISKGANDWNKAVHIAISINSIELVDFFYSKGATVSMNKALMRAIEYRCENLVRVFLQRGADNLEDALEYAVEVDLETSATLIKRKIASLEE